MPLQMYRHGQFAVLSLSYFVYRADLPVDLKEAFYAKAQDHFVTTEQLVQLARKQVRDLRRVPSLQDSNTATPSINSRWIAGMRSGMRGPFVRP
jgi:hypothetical protein